MPIFDIAQRFRSQLSILGKAGLNAIFPNDFEYYLVAFEVLNSNGDSIEYFSFPVLPETIQESQPEITNIQKTAGGVVVIDNDTFVPTDITLSGTFGRYFKVLINSRINFFGGFSLGFRNREFSSFVKTGYGCIKALERIKRLSRQLDKFDKPHKLVFYNLVLGNSYIVKFVDFTHSQNINDSNMIPKYSIVLRSIGTLDGSGQSFRGLLQTITAGFVQRGLNNTVSRIRRSF